MSLSTMMECADCGKTADEMYVNRCNFCDKPICRNCAAWLPAGQDTFHGVYHTVNRICKDCRPLSNPF